MFNIIKKQNKKLMTNTIYIVCIILLTIILSSCTRLTKAYNPNKLYNNLYMANTDMFASGVAKNIIVPSLNKDDGIETVGATNYIIASLDRNMNDKSKYLAPYVRVPMASLTKLMTALVVLENCNDLNKEYYVTTDAVDLEKDVSSAKLKPGDKLTVKDLLYGLIVPSGNDAAMVLAENLVDNYDNFLVMMNNEAVRIGALHTHFANPHGLDSEYHFSTAYDLFLIMRELQKYPIFNEISLTKQYEATITASDGTVRKEEWINTDLFVLEEIPISTEVNLLGGKTGTTKTAGNCLATIVKDKNRNCNYICIVLNAKSKRNVYHNTNSLVNVVVK